MMTAMKRTSKKRRVLMVASPFFTWGLISNSRSMELDCPFSDLRTFELSSSLVEWRHEQSSALRENQVSMQVVLRMMTMNDEKTKQKAIEAVANIYGVDSIAADLKEQTLTVTGEMDAVAIAKKLKKIGKVDIVSVGPSEQEKTDDEK
ncbi:hypothetical protein D5086_006967 [Populus alba]|uniref:Uncharacterized protein n=1 Tax=Populus alba TaxID=43335 RepID=A0ACC4CNC7_POPAL